MGNLKMVGQDYPRASSLDEVSGRISPAHKRLPSIGHAAGGMYQAYACAATSGRLEDSGGSIERTSGSGFAFTHCIARPQCCPPR